MVNASKYFIILAVIFLVITQSINADDKTKWAEAQQEFQKNKASKKPGVKFQATRRLVEAIYPAAEPEAVGALISHLKDEFALSTDGKHEERVDESILDMCVSGLKKMTTEKAIDKMIALSKNASTNWRIRFYILRGMGGINNSKIIPALLELAQDKDPRIKIAVFDSFGDLKAKEGADAGCKLLNSEETWEVKIAVVNYLSKLKEQSTVEPLIQALNGKNLDGLPRAEVANVLKQLTGADYGTHGSSWLQWQNNKKTGATSVAGDKPKQFTVSYYGVEATTTRVVFMLDTSISMDWEQEWIWKESDKEVESTAKATDIKSKFANADGSPAAEALVNTLKAKMESVRNRKVTKRIHAAQRELIATIYDLDPSVYFTIIFFSQGARIWKETLVPATAENKLAAMEEIDKQSTTSGTSTFDALEMAYKLGEITADKDKKIALDKKAFPIEKLGGVDTIFMATDGKPSSGKIVPPDEIVAEIKKINALRKIRINTFAVGSEKGIPQDAIQKWGLNGCMPDPQFLKNLAEATGGIFVDKTTK